MSDTHLKHIGKMVQTMRKAKNLSQAELAESSGMTREYIGLIERGSVNPSVEVLMKIASALNCYLDVLLIPVDK
jgi:transcriptional regulator with XRE-family HTH domain